MCTFVYSDITCLNRFLLLSIRCQCFLFNGGGGGEFVRGAIVRGAIVLGGDCPGGDCLGGRLSGGECPGGDCLGGDCPRQSTFTIMMGSISNQDLIMISHHNIRGYHIHKAELQAFLEDHSPDVVTLNETFTKKGYKYNMPHYTACDQEQRT